MHWFKAYFLILITQICKTEDMEALNFHIKILKIFIIFIFFVLASRFISKQLFLLCVFA